jgi:NAD(P)-dependent dehydrogenase (short-subunit alcohol dehydrogenase family)
MAATVGTRLQNKIAVITGASSGIGRQIALAYASEGSYVVYSDLDAAPRGRRSISCWGHHIPAVVISKESRAN